MGRMAPLMESMEIHRPSANQTCTVLSYDPDILGDTGRTRADSKASKAYEWRMASDMWGCGLLRDRVNEEKKRSALQPLANRRLSLVQALAVG